MVVCRPHNPTGTVEPAADVERFLQRVPSDTVVLLDEAYVEFLSPRAPDRRAGPWCERFPNVVVLRTFSKAYGLAGLRIGYGFCAPDLARQLWTMQLPFGIGITSLVAVAASYDAEAQLQQRIRLITAERRLSAHAAAGDGRLQHRRARQLRLPACERPTLARGVRRHRPAGAHYADGGVRITVGNRQSTRAVLAALEPFGVALNCVVYAASAVRYEEAWPQNRRPNRASEIRSRWRAPTGSAPGGVTSPTAWSR